MKAKIKIKVCMIALLVCATPLSGFANELDDLTRQRDSLQGAIAAQQATAHSLHTQIADEVSHRESRIKDLEARISTLKAEADARADTIKMLQQEIAESRRQSLQ